MIHEMSNFCKYVQAMSRDAERHTNPRAAARRLYAACHSMWIGLRTYRHAVRGAAYVATVPAAQAIGDCTEYAAMASDDFALNFVVEDLAKAYRLARDACRTHAKILAAVERVAGQRRVP